MDCQRNTYVCHMSYKNGIDVCTLTLLVIFHHSEVPAPPREKWKIYVALHNQRSFSVKSENVDKANTSKVTNPLKN